MNELFYGSLAEREALAEAITNKGVDTNVSDTLTTMADNVRNISSPNAKGTLNVWSQDSLTPSISVTPDKLYVVTIAVPGVTNSCSLTSGATQIDKQSWYRSCGAGLYCHTFLIRTTSNTVTFSVNANPAITWYQIEE